MKFLVLTLLFVSNHHAHASELTFNHMVSPLEVKELKVENTLRSIFKLFTKGDVRIEINNSPTRIEYRVYISAEDERRLRSFGDTVERSIMQIFNELSILWERDRVEGTKNFDPSKIKHITININPTK